MREIANEEATVMSSLAFKPHTGPATVEGIRVGAVYSYSDNLGIWVYGIQAFGPSIWFTLVPLRRQNNTGYPGSRCKMGLNSEGVPDETIGGIDAVKEVEL